MLKVVVQVLSLRALLLGVLTGAFVLTMRAMTEQSPMATGVLVAYCIFTIVPLAYMEIRRKAE